MARQQGNGDNSRPIRRAPYSRNRRQNGQNGQNSGLNGQNSNGQNSRPNGQNRRPNGQRQNPPANHVVAPPPNPPPAQVQQQPRVVMTDVLNQIMQTAVGDFANHLTQFSGQLLTALGEVNTNLLSIDNRIELVRKECVYMADKLQKLVPDSDSEYEGDDEVKFPSPFF